MTRREDLQRQVPAEDRPGFDRWLRANVVVGSLFASLLIAMALAAINAPGPPPATAEGTETKFTASQSPGERSAILSTSDPTVGAAPDSLASLHPDEPF